MPRAGSSAAPGTLGRYQACHRCRRRKLKCDGSNPCLHCRKSHEQALKDDPLKASSAPSCTYDSPDLKVLGPKARITVLESEIAELHDLLRLANNRLAQCTCGAAHIPDSQTITETSSSSLQPLDTTLESEIQFSFPPPALPNPNQFTPAAPVESDSVPNHSHNSTEAMPHDESPGSFELTMNTWPLNIPPPATLFHLVEVFFSSVPLASRLIHKPTFISNLSNVPTSPDFPHVALLHAICALASIYSPAMTQSPHKMPNDIDRVRILSSAIMDRPEVTLGPQGRHYFPRRVEDILDPIPEGFGAMHERWAAESMKPSLRINDRGLQLLQAAIVMTWYHYNMGIAIPLYTWLGHVMRFVYPFGMNIGEGFEPLTRLPPEMLYIAKTPKAPIEAENWRNIFWITYVTERVCTAGIVWPVNMHDDDVSQIMPCRLSDFISGTFVPPQGRQQLFTDNMLLHHPSLTTDSWTIYIKATVLVSKVRSFNARYRVQCKLRRLDPVTAPTQTDEFQSLDRTISAFVQSIPRALRRPVGERVDPLLYVALLLPHMAMIQLHDPHAQLDLPDDYSSAQLLSAARDILELVYKLSATSFDVIYLDHACGICWFMAGATIIRFIGAKIDANDEEEIAVLTQELAPIKSLLSKLGERTAMGLRKITLLNELHDQVIRERGRTVSAPRG